VSVGRLHPVKGPARPGRRVRVTRLRPRAGGRRHSEHDGTLAGARGATRVLRLVGWVSPMEAGAVVRGRGRGGPGQPPGGTGRRPCWRRWRPDAGSWPPAVGGAARGGPAGRDRVARRPSRRRGPAARDQESTLRRGGGGSTRRARSPAGDRPDTGSSRRPPSCSHSSALSLFDNEGDARSSPHHHVPVHQCGVDGRLIGAQQIRERPGAGRTAISPGVELLTDPRRAVTRPCRGRASSQSPEGQQRATMGPLRSQVWRPNADGPRRNGEV